MGNPAEFVIDPASLRRDSTGKNAVHSNTSSPVVPLRHFPSGGGVDHYVDLKNSPSG
jgi:hypothetical protein